MGMICCTQEHYKIENSLKCFLLNGSVGELLREAPVLSLQKCACV